MSAERPLDQSMSLLNEMMRQPVDPSYAAAAARRVTRGLPRSTSTRTVLVFVTMILIGTLFAVAALEVSSTASVVGQARAQLIEQIEARQAHGDELTAQAGALERDVAAARQAALGNPGQAVLARLTTLEVVTGEATVTGPGLILTLDDAEDATVSGGDPRGQAGFGSGRVSATDLQFITNGLWQAGAEAMAINGQRLTARSAIRFAGEAILVDFRPLARPYVVNAIGDPAGLQARFVGSSTGSYFTALRANYKLRTEITGSDSLTLTGHSSPALRFARIAGSGIPSTPDAASASTSPAATPASPTTASPTSEKRP